MAVLDQRQLRDWTDQGCLVLPAVFDAPSLAPLRAAAADIVAGFDFASQRTTFGTHDRDAGRDEAFFASAEGVHCFLEEGAVNADGSLNRPRERAVNKIGHALHDRVPAFTAFCRHPVFGDLLRQLGQARPVLWQSMVIFKQPRIGGEVRWHQDATYLHTRPPGVVGLWLALEDATLENGCLLLAPGAHHSPLRELYEVDWNTRKGQLRTLDTTPWPTAVEARALEVPAGSLVVFSDLMPHYSAPNRSARSRQALTLHFTDLAADWSPANWLQRPTLGPFEV